MFTFLEMLLKSNDKFNRNIVISLYYYRQ